MKRTKKAKQWFPFLVAAFLVVGSGFSVNVLSQEEHQEQKSEQQADVSNKEIKKLIENLSASSYAEREKATKRLIEIGSSALDELKEARKTTSDPEAIWRMDYIISRVKEKDSTEKPRKNNGLNGPDFGSEFQFETRRVQTGPNGETVKIVREGKDGPVTVVVEKEKNGETVREKYTADSVEKFQNKYPDIAKKYDINRRPGFTFRIKPWGIEPENDFEKRFDQRWEHMEKELERWMKELKEPMRPDNLFEDFREELKKLQERLRNKDFGWPGEEFGRSTSTNVGFQGSSPGPILRHHLNLDENQGVLVQSVQPDSKAAKIGIKQWDVIFAVDGSTVSSELDVKKQIRESLQKDGEVNISIYRSGQKKTLRHSGSSGSSEKENKSSRKKNY